MNPTTERKNETMLVNPDHILMVAKPSYLEPDNSVRVLMMGGVMLQIARADYDTSGLADYEKNLVHAGGPKFSNE